MDQKLNYTIVELPGAPPGFWGMLDGEKHVWTFHPLFPEDPHAPKRKAPVFPYSLDMDSERRPGRPIKTPKGWGGWMHPGGIMEYWGIDNPTESWQKDVEKHMHPGTVDPDKTLVEAVKEQLKAITYDPLQDPSSAWYKAFKKWGGRDFPRSSLSSLTMPEDATDKERISILELEVTMLENKLLNVTAMRDRLESQLMERNEHQVRFLIMDGSVYPELGTVVPATHPDHGTCIAWYQCGQWIVISTISNHPTVVSADCIKWYKKISSIQKNTVTSH